MTDRRIKVGFVGAGYIAKWHAQALGQLKNVEIVAVCDRSQSAAKGLAALHGAQAFTSVDQMISAGVCDAVHILTPPESHHSIAMECIAGGLNVLVEKPFALSSEECRDISQAARNKGVVAAVGHNFVCLKSYLRLKQIVDQGLLGRVSSLDVNWCFPFEPLRAGPFGIWPLKQPGNILLELGPHLLAFVQDLVGDLEDVTLRLGKPVDVPGCGRRYQSWQILGRAGAGVDVRLQLSLVEVIDDRSVTVLGSSGRARLDYAMDTLLVERQNAGDIVFNDLEKQTSLATQYLRSGFSNALRQTASLNQRSPYAAGFIEASSAFYEAIASGAPIVDRLSADTAARVMMAIERILECQPEPSASDSEPSNSHDRQVPVLGAPVMVIGGTGFLGRDLVRGLVENGYKVKVVSRSRSSIFDEYCDRVEFVTASLTDRAALSEAMKGVGIVYNLARALGTSWEDCLENDLKPTLTIAEACVDAGVERLVYTGTIASFDMSDPAQEITEATGFATDMSHRNLYARSKAHCETELLAFAKKNGLNLVLARPGIVVGTGGPLQHWGIGRWHGAGAVRIWGRGTNKLPFVLVSDVTDALVAMGESTEAIGQSFNLVGDVLLTAHEYFDGIHQSLGARIAVRSSSLTGMYAASTLKYLLKKYALGHRDAIHTSLRDWRSRAHYSPFRNDLPKEVLGWRPIASREAFIRAAIKDADLFGF